MRPRSLHRRSRLSLAAVLLVGAVIGVVLPGSTPARADEVWPVGGDGIALIGHGFGHGHGMGQYGAQGAALQGLGYRDILAFYYPGTTLGALPGGGTIRVLISEDSDDDVVVHPAAGLTATDADGARFVLPAGPSAWRVIADPSGGQHLEQYDGAWQPWTPPGGRQAFYRVTFDAQDRIRLDLPDGSARAYRGSLSAERGVGAALTTVNTVNMEQYLQGVVPRESPSSFAVEALRAQAVAARSYAAYKRANSPQPTYDICSTTACQVYGGSALWSANGTFTELEAARTNDAVAATAGQVLLSGGRPAFTEFSSSTGGWNTQGSMPYLAAQPDPYDDFPGNPVHTWQTTVSAAALAAAWPTVGPVRTVRILARDGHGDWGGRVTSLRVEGDRGSVTLTGDDFRSKLGLRSTWFTLPLSAIQTHWLQLGGSASFLGAATSGERAVPGGVVQDFQGGRIYWSAATGAWSVHGLIGDAYDAFGGPGSVLGLPVTDEQAHVDGRRSLFQGGGIYWTPPTGAHVVMGAIGQHYVSLGGAAAEGWPLANEEALPGGAQSRFTGGRIFWSPSTGAWEVHGLILEHYLLTGGPTALPGYPTTDEYAVPGGRASSFAYGTLYWSLATGVHDVQGDILASYLAAGGPGSTLGLPVSDEYAVPGGRRTDFAGGALVWNAATRVVSRVAR